MITTHFNNCIKEQQPFASSSSVSSLNLSIILKIMKFLVTFLLLVAVTMIAASPYVPPVQKPKPGSKPFPTFPGQGPFNPRPGRYPRSPKDNNGQIDVHAKKEGGKTSWSVEGQQKIWGNKHGSVHVSAGANKQPGGRPQGQVGIGGSFHWG